MCQGSLVRLSRVRLVHLLRIFDALSRLCEPRVRSFERLLESDRRVGDILRSAHGRKRLGLCRVQLLPEVIELYANVSRCQPSPLRECNDAAPPVVDVPLCDASTGAPSSLLAV